LWDSTFVRQQKHNLKHFDIYRLFLGRTYDELECDHIILTELVAELK